MKPGKLYIKIFVSFVLILLVTEILIFGFFLIFAGRHFRERTISYANAQALLAKEFVEEKVRSAPGTDPADNRALRDLLHRLEESYDARVWLSDAAGDVLIPSFKGGISPETLRTVRNRAKDMGNFRIYRSHRKGMTLYVAVPLILGAGRPAALHLFYEDVVPRHVGPAFALGLLVIGCVIALLLIPVSKRFTGPIKLLEQSADKIAKGDLSHRATIKSRDEIGDMGRSFNRMADRMEEMIRDGRELTANVSHQLRSPLSRIRIAAELIREKIEKKDIGRLERLSEQIQEEIEELDRLIGGILDFSKVTIKEAGRRLEPIDLSEMIQELADRFAQAAKQKNLRVTLELPPLRKVPGDRDALRTAISNILDNAVKYTPGNGGLGVAASQTEDRVVIVFENTCETLSRVQRDRLFEPFYRAETGSAQGSGLGLAITKKIVESHGGAVRALPRDGGLAVEVTLRAPPGSVGQTG